MTNDEALARATSTVGAMLQELIFELIQQKALQPEQWFVALDRLASRPDAEISHHILEAARDGLRNALRAER
jgi:hypothetical protein